MKRSWLIFYHSICANDFSCINARGCGAPPQTETEQKDIFELLHRRRKKSSTIFCSQYIFKEWYNQLGGEASPLADATIDRIVHDSYQINITSIDAEHDLSM